MDMFLVPTISSGQDLDVNLFGGRPVVRPLYVKLPSGDLQELESRKGLVRDGENIDVVSSRFTPIVHQDLFEALHDEIAGSWPVRFWQVETAVSHDAARARVTWFLRGEKMKWEFGESRWTLMVIAYNAYDRYLPTAVQLGVVHGGHGGRIKFPCTQEKVRARGKTSPVDRLVPKTVDLIRRCNKEVVPLLERLHNTAVDEEKLDSVMDSLTDKWIRKEGKKEVRLRFLAEEHDTMLELAGLIGWYATKRVSSVGRQLMYQQELIYREVADVADLK